MAGYGWELIADGVYRRRYDPMDISVTAILGESGLTIVDTRSTPAEGAEIVADVRAGFSLPIVAVVNTHAHFDHSFGNQSFPSVPIYGHELIPRHYEQYEAPRLAAYRADAEFEPDKDWAEVVLTPPTHLIGEPTMLSLGGHAIELIPLEPGHTDTDLVVFIPEQRVWILGDVIEESGAPMYGSGNFPLQWPGVLGRLLEKIEPGDILVPGHGAVVDREFVRKQMGALQGVADRIRENWRNQVPVEDAIRSLTGSAWPISMLEPAFTRGYVQLDSEGA